MPEVRKDIFTGTRVLVSELRGSRPFSASTVVYGEKRVEECPFCPGNERLTPENYDGEKWSMRFFPNKYPALTEGIDIGRDDAGFHDVFVDTREHEFELKDFTKGHLEAVLRALKERYALYTLNRDMKYVQIFKNKGPFAGATQKHSHWQIIGGRFVPSIQETVERNLSSCERKTGGCLYCDELKKELKEGERVVSESESFAVITPYASRFTYEMWVMPKRHFSTLSQLTDSEIPELSKALLDSLNALDKIKKGVDYNILFMDAPATKGQSLFHWHIQILPRMGGLAGYEFSTGSYINHICPEKASGILRNIINGGTNE